MTTATAYETLQEMGVSEEALDLITNINGCSMETMEDVLFAVSGCRTCFGSVANWLAIE